MAPKKAQATYLRVGKGDTIPPGAVQCNVGKWRNEWRKGGKRTVPDYMPEDLGAAGSKITDAAHAVEVYAAWLKKRPLLRTMMREQLAGKVLTCTCQPGEICHVQLVIIPTVNADPE